MRFGVRMSFESEALLSNVKRQAKRLSKKLSLPLGQCQEGLAICLYGCNNYSDLLKKIRSEPFDNPLITLSALSPHSELFLAKLLAIHQKNILENFGKRFPDSNLNEEDLVALFGLGLEEFKVKISD